MCTYTLYNEAASFGPHLIQEIMVSGRQLSVPSSSTVTSICDLYILCSVYCAVHMICTYGTEFTVLYMRTLHTVQCTFNTNL